MVPSDELEGYHKRSKVRIAVWAGIISIALIGLLYGALKPADENRDQGRAPDFRLPLLDGSGFLTDDDLAGGPVVVNFWASWCDPCRDEIPLFEEAWGAYQDQGLTVVGVNIQDQLDDARAFVKEFDVTYPVIRDADQELARALQVNGLPQTFYLGAGWTLFGTQTFGEVTPAELEERIAKLLGPATPAD